MKIIAQCEITDDLMFESLEHSAPDGLRKAVAGYIETIPYVETYEDKRVSRSATKKASSTISRSTFRRLCPGTRSFAPINAIATSLSAQSSFLSAIVSFFSRYKVSAGKRTLGPPCAK